MLHYDKAMLFYFLLASMLCGLWWHKSTLKHWLNLRLVSLFILAFGSFLPVTVHAYQRSYLNLGFESPVIDTTAPCRVYISNTRVPGWLTTHPFGAEQSTAECTSPISVTGSGQLIEIWKGPRAIGGGGGTTDRMPARQGSQFVELNAEAVSELQQNICLVSGEPVTWTFSHNGRNAANDTLVFRAGSQPIANVSTSTTGDGAVTNCYAGSCSVTSNVLTQDGITRWADYTGTFTYTGPSGQTVIGFQSTSGSATNGNFLDGVQITVKPIVEFTSANYITPENNGSPSPVQVVVAGIVPTGGLVLTFNVTGGTAILGGDYTINGGSANTFSATVPAGDYGQGTPLVINVPVSIIDDTVNEVDETFTVSLSPTSTFHLMSTSVCGASGNGVATYTIVDDDAATDMDLRVIKSQRQGTTGAFQTTPLTIVSGNTIQYRFVISNRGVNTVSATSLATFTDAIPANITGLGTPTFTGGSGATTCLGTRTGNTINGTFSGPTNATCTVTIQGTATTSGTITNTATVTTPAGNTDIFPSDNSSSVVTTIAYATLVLNKVSLGDVGTFSYTLANTAQTSGSVTTTIPSSSTQVDGDTGDAGTQAFSILNNTSAVTISEASVAGWTLEGATCTNSSGATVGSFANPTYTIPTGSLTAGNTYTCTFLNRKNPMVTVEKISYGGTAGFTFSDTNLTGSIGTLTTSTSGVGVSSAPLTVTATNTDVTITETLVGGYTLTTASCIDENAATTGNIGTFGSLATNVLTIPASYFLTGAEIKCTFNNRRSTTLTLRKTWAAGSQAGHTATVNSSGFINSVTSGTSTATAAGNTTTGTATTVYVGESGTISEIFGGGAVAADYAASLACTGTNGSLSGNTLTITQSTGTAITCTYTNTKLPKITLTKISNGGVGAFTFTGDNGFTSQTITTVTAGTGVAGATQTLAAVSTATTITETIPAGYEVTAINCTGLGSGGTATPNLATGSVVLNAAATAAGTNIACTFTNRKKPLIRVNKTVSSLFDANDRFTTEIRTVSATGTVVSTTGSSLTTGGGVLTTGGAATYNATGKYEGAVGTQYFITESITAGTSVLGRYTTSISCTNALSGSATVLPSGTTAPFTITPQAGDDISCTLTNTVRQPTVTISKVSTGAVGTFNFTNTNLSSASSALTTTVVSTPVNTAALTVTNRNNNVTVQETVPANWTLSSVTCVDNNSAVTSNPASFGTLVGSQITILPANLQVGADIVCTFTNRKSAQLTLNKAWVNAKVNDAVNITSTGGTNNPSLSATANTLNETDSASAITVFAGETLTFSESFTTGTAADYNTTLACTGATDTNPNDGLVINAADTAISCTYTNSRKSATLRLLKAWGANSINGNVANIGATTGFINNTTAFNSTASTSSNSNTVTVYAGESGTLPAETMSTGSLANYNTTLSCDNGVTPSGTNGQTTNTISIPNTVSGLITCTYTNTRKSSTFRLAKAWGANSITGNVANIAATTGLTNNTAAFTSTASTNTNGAFVTVFAGETVTIPAETMSTGTLANYNTTLACTADGGATANTLSGTNGQAANTLVIGAGDATKAITCTYTNTRKAVTLQLAKAWGANSITGNVVNIGATTGLANNTTAFTSTASTNATSGSVTAFVGETITFPAETMSTGTLANYNTTLACTADGGATANTLSGTNGQTSNTLVIGAADAGKTLLCTYTNTRKTATFRLAKTWSANSITGNVASLGATTGLINNTTAFTSTASTNTNGTAVTVYAGETATLPAETMTTGTLANYNTTLSCDNGVTPSGTNGQTSNTVTVPNTVSGLITCTYTNTRKTATLRLAKAWGVNSIAGNVANIGATTGFVNNTTAFNSTASTANNSNTVTVFAGETGTLPAETMSTGTLANYNTTLSCDNGVTPSGTNGQTTNTLTIPNTVSSLITCTYTNNRISQGVTLTKNWVNPFAGSAVNLTITGATGATAGSSTAGGTTTPATATGLAGSTITFAETFTANSASNYNTTLTCTKNSNGSTVTVTSNSITMPSDSAVTCTFTNTALALPTVTLTKVSNGDVGTFSFSGDNGFGSENITTLSSGVGVTGTTHTLSAGGTQTIITETIPSGYALTGISCTGLGSGGTATNNLTAGTVTLNAAATAMGSNIACTFTNAKLPTITLTKVSIDDTGAFSFSGNNGFGTETINTTSFGVGATGSTRTLTSSAFSTSTVITETIPSGYSLTNISCSGLGSGGTATNNLSAGTVTLNTAATAAGANINCTFTNTANSTPPTSFPAQIACNAAEITQQFSFGGANTWPGGTSSKSFVVGTAPNNVTVTFTNTQSATPISGDPSLQTLGAVPSSLQVSSAGGLAANALIATLSLTPSRSINKLSYSMYDHDYQNDGSNNFRDRTIVSANNGATIFPTSLTAQVSGNQTINAATGTTTATNSSSCGTNSANCNVYVAYNTTGINSANTEFRAAHTGTSTQEYIGFNQFAWCLPRHPTVTIAKRSLSGTGTFNFNNTNLTASTAAITTATAGTTVNAATTNVSTANQDVVIQEVAQAGWVVTGASCTDDNAGITGNPASFGTLAGNTLTVPATNVRYGAEITCTFTNQKVVPLTLNKVWTNAKVNDAVTISSTGGTVNPSLSAVANTANETDTASVANVYVGQTLTFSETFTTGSAANYNSSLACTGAADTNLADGLTIGGADTAISCTYTNSRKAVTVTANKTWTNAKVNDAVSITTTGGTNNVNFSATANTANETDSATAITVYAGDVLTFAENFSTGSAANYNSSLACTGAADTNLADGLTIGGADTAISCTYTNSRKAVTVTANKTWTNAKVNDAVSITTTGGTNNVNFSATANTANETDSATAITVYAGDVLTFAENFSTGSAANYNSSLACTGAADTNPADGLTIGGADTAISCTYTNNRKAVTVTANKTWTNAKVNDAVSITTTGGTNNVNFSAIANTANETDSASAITVYAGDVLTFAENFSTGSAANYNSSLACTGAADTNLADGLTISGADTAISCTYTNSRKAVTVTANKTWTNAKVNDAVSITTTGGTNNVNFSATANTANETDSATAVTVYAGDVLTFAESFSTGSAANYNSSLACTGAADTNLADGLTIGDADTAISCTYTNSRKASTFRLAKAWGAFSMSGNVANIAATTGLTNNTTAFTSTASTAANSNTVTVYAGDVATLPAETMSTGTLSNYNTVLSCTTNAGATANTVSGTNGQNSNTLSIGAGDEGKLITCTYTNTRITQTLSLAKQWTNAANGHTATVTTTGGTNNATVNSTSTGNNLTTGTAVTVYAGDVVTLPAETFGGGASATDYNTTLACTGGTSLASGAVARSITISNSTTATTCTYTNSRKTATFRLAKAWGVNSISGNVANIGATTGLSNNTTAFTSTASTGTNSNTVTVYVGETVTLPAETMSVGSLANYTTSLVCTTNAGATANTVSGTNGQNSNTLSVGAGDEGKLITCTYTNTRKSVSLTANKTWTNAKVNDAVSITTTGGTNNVNFSATANTANETDSATAITVYAGDILTFAESFSTGSAANYNSSLACTGATDTNPADGLTIGGADTAISCTYTNSRKAVTVTANKTWTNAKVNDAVSITTTGGTNNVNFSATANTANETDSATAVTVYAGDVLTFAESFSTGSAANYNSSLACTGATDTNPTDGLTIGGADTAISCTYTNSRKAVTVTANKTWTNAKVNDAVSITTTGGTNNVNFSATANTANETDSATAITVYAGDVLTFAESFSTGSAANYNSSLACTGATDTNLADGLTIGGADTAISCTYTNSRKAVTVTANKTWTNAKVNDAVSITTTGGTNNVNFSATANTANETDSASAITMYAGDVLTFAESFSTGSAANYNSSLACTGATDTNPTDGLTIGGADTAISCTYTNSRKSASLRLVKTWSNAIVNDTATLVTTGFANNASLNSIANTANETDTGTVVTVFAGETGTLAETLGAANNGVYSASLWACAGGSLVANSLTINASDEGNSISCTITNSIVLPKVRVHKELLSYVSANDVITTEIRTGGVAGTVVSNTTASTTVGGGVVTTAGATGTYNTAGTYQGMVGATYTITESISGSTTSTDQYETSISCTNAYTASTTVLPTTYSATLGADITVNSGDDISCTLSNRIKQPVIRVNKVVSSLVNASDRFTTQVRTGGVSGAVVSTTSSSTTTGGGVVTTGGAGTYNAAGSYQGIVGTSYTITEIISAGSSPLSQYTTTISCTNARVASTTPLPSTAPFILTPAAGDDISCTLTNIANSNYTISGKVFLDNGKNAAIPHNAIQEADEAGIANIPVRLTDCAATVYQTVLTGGDGSYSLAVPSSLSTGATLCVEEQQPLTYLSVTGTAGNTGGSYSLAADRTQFSLTVGMNYTNINFGDVSESQLTAQGSQTIAVGATAEYDHQFIAGTEGSVTFSTTQAPNPVLTGWSSVLYLDNNCNAALDVGDTQITAPINVVAEQIVCLIQKVYSPAAANTGAQNQSTITASFALTAPSTIVKPYTRSDNTTLADSSLVLTKTVREVMSCPSTGADTNPYTTNNEAKPNALIEYRIQYSNPSTSTVRDIVIHDTTPAFTTFRSARCITTPATLNCDVPSVLNGTAPAVGGTGSIDWILHNSPTGLEPGQSGEVRFCVRIDP
ncbi:hypothetical protein [Agitococcus lubricus]|uniref:Repeat protein (TIGR01451 family) n=1 Tax=Agitococcus lubricus TaxID=1077255 RepID=A0A2T5J0T2_9GAMM|nr:hypothetical protein [Agitococcus lubricus]PTQ89995.1 hypothetical protein C8N29_10433 [Agitococcus lubricus]